jgi:ubiquinone/menaquinone biosynthesis C-methylase UbiE
MMNRRTLFSGTAASMAIGSLIRTRAAEAAEGAKELVKEAKDMNFRGKDGRLQLLGSLDLESQQDFSYGVRVMHAKKIRTTAQTMFLRTLARKGVDPETPVTVGEVMKLVEDDQGINIAQKTWLWNQHIMWKGLQDYFHANADFYLAEMEAADRSGPGTLELNPRMDVPPETRHEIHIQPGGYVGDPFAGHIYHYGTNSFYISVLGHNEQDQIHKRTAERMPLPTDGKVKRILDMGCGIGQFTCGLKERFPDAEVWGIDVGGPMVRYGHMRARKLGIGANFAQRLAEDTKFPDNYFDMTVSYIMHHEVPAANTIKIINEARRVTRPGGTFYPIDFNTRGATKGAAWGMYSLWFDSRWNNEVWHQEFDALDFTAEIAKRGFAAAKQPVVAVPGFGVRHFIRTA